MARKKSTVAPAESLTLSSAAVGSLEEEVWFRRLSDDDKLKVSEEDRQLAAVYQNFNRSRLAAAAHLSHIHEILGPLKVFERYIKRYHLKRRSAYRAIKAYNNVRHLPQIILTVAAARNMPLMGETESAPYGVYTDAVKRLPPPKSADEGKAVEYLDMLEVKRKEIKPKPIGDRPQEVLGSYDPKDLMREAFRFVDVRYRRLPSEYSARKKIEWLRTLSGMVFQIAGASSEQLVPIIAPPSDFKAVRGRPKAN